MLRTILLCGGLLIGTAAAGWAQGPDPADPTMAAARAAYDAGNLVQSISLYKKAAGQGQAAAESELARIYMQGGTGIAPDYAAAMSHAQKAVDMGDSRGDLYLGIIWMQGLGVSADLNKAAGYFRQGDDAGDMKSARYLGLIARSQEDTAAAARWFEKGAGAGDITSQYYLGQAYATGAGVPQDYAKAMEWYVKAASRGDEVASDGMVGEAGLYENGAGVPKDMDRALALYRQAAELGNAEARAALARLGQ